MGNRIEVKSLESGVTATIELLDKEAPKTCEAMWKCLETPMETEGIHAMWVGRELMFVMPEENQRVDPTSIPLENATSHPLPGDVLFGYYPAHVTRQYHDDIRGKPIWDFYIVYGPDAIMNGPATVWAHVVEGLENLASECRKIREEGTKPFRVGRLA